MLGAEAFLPRIRCVFYAVFDHEQGPKVVYQVPEGSIIAPADPPPLSTPATPAAPSFRSRSRTTPGLFEFDSISQYVIPKDQLCGRLVRCNTPSHRIIGFPVKLSGQRYLAGHRNSFRYNICFVFDRTADISCYEPIVRKTGRVLLACEQESCLLSGPDSIARIQPLLEQLYEDLNSYSETSIPIDEFNSLELQIFPFYPNPPKVSNWQVPVALINLEKRKEPNWDLAMAKITPHINGMNHVQRIADLADVSPELTRHCLEHLLFYQCIMMIDIFQYSNMYTLKANFQWLAEEVSVQEECSEYVTKPGFPLIPLSDLLHLYSHLKPGKTLHTFCEEHNLPSSERAIDVQRFVTFGIIKGFLRRVHRWPVLLPRDRALLSERISGSVVDTSPVVSTALGVGASALEVHGADAGKMNLSVGAGPRVMPNWGAASVLERGGSILSTILSPPTASQIPHHIPAGPAGQMANVIIAEPVNAPLAAQLVANATSRGSPSFVRSSSNLRRNDSGGIVTVNGGGGNVTGVGTGEGVEDENSSANILERLPALLDGSRHTDELCTMFRLSWRELERKLIEVGEGDYEHASEERIAAEGGARTDRLGRVRIIYR